MRNAERYLAQGKIQSAIGEYKQVVANDPKDFGTLNMLGDLHTKNSDKNQAVKCYTAVAEHYSKQGFAQKAIAVYNKISKIQPGSIEISAKLADLYKFKGSTNEARSHYKIVAEHYEREGLRLEALETRKQIASLDPNDTQIQLDLAAAYLQENQIDDAADAFGEAGIRLAKKNLHSDAIGAFEKALEIRSLDSKILTAFTQSHFACGSAAAAADRLAEIHADHPHDRDVLHLLIDCQLAAGNTAEAERSLIGLVEKEPANYPKLVSLTRTYIEHRNAESAARTMAMLSEHLLVAGEADEFQSLLTDILTLDPDQLEGLRLRARFAAWQRDDAGMLSSLAHLATVAQRCGSTDDERFALSQLVMLAPHEVKYAERLHEINAELGYEDGDANESLFDSQFMKAPPPPAEEPQLETFAPAEENDADAGVAQIDAADFGDFAIVGAAAPELYEIDQPRVANTETDDERLLREVDSIRFYIDSGYLELAEKAINELKGEFGECSQIEQLRRYLVDHQSDGTAPEETIDIATPAPAVVSAPAISENRPSVASTNGNGASSSAFDIADFRNELGLDESDADLDSDYETHYHTAVAYQEMGLLDEAIKEFQDAVSLVQPNDATRRFFQCANLLGHCFMLKSMPNLALTWYRRALETPGLNDDEKQGIWYELAAAYEAEGDLENAGRYFEQVYAENIDFRDVSDRVKNISVGR